MVTAAERWTVWRVDCRSGMYSRGPSEGVEDELNGNDVSGLQRISWGTTSLKPKFFEARGPQPGVLTCHPHQVFIPSVMSLIRLGAPFSLGYPCLCTTSTSIVSCTSKNCPLLSLYTMLKG